MVHPNFPARRQALAASDAGPHYFFYTNIAASLAGSRRCDSDAMGFFYDLFSFFTGFLGAILLLRAWLWSLAISPRDPLVSVIWRLTDWFVNPVAYVIKPRGNWEWTCLISALLVAVVQVLIGREVIGFPATAMGFALAPFALVLRWAVNLLIWGLILYVIAGFFGPRYIGYQSMLSTLVDPFLRPIRRFLPRIAGMDFSAALLFLILCVLLRLITPASMGFWML